MAVTWKKLAFISDVVYGSSWDGVVDEAPSKNAVYDEMELRLKAAAVIGDNKLVRGDGGSRGVQAASTITVSDNGEMTNTGQPCFFVRPTVDQDNIAASTNVTIIWGTENVDVGNNFASNTFTAPVTGKYQFNVSVSLNYLDAGAVYVRIGLRASSTSVFRYFSIFGPSDISYVSLPVSSIIDMDVNDTCYTDIYFSGGASQSDLQTTSRFSGALIC